MSTLPELKYSPTHTWARVDGEYRSEERRVGKEC